MLKLRVTTLLALLLVSSLLVAGIVALSWETPVAPSPKRIVGYYIQWGVYARNYRVKDVKTSGSAERLTHINYAFGNIVDNKCHMVTETGVGDAYADYQVQFNSDQSIDGVKDTPNELRGNFNQLRKLKAQYPHLKVLISLGGWTWSKGFSDAALPENRAAVAKSCIDMYIRGDLPKSGNSGGPGAAAGVFDGIDIDWEYPVEGGKEGMIHRPEDRQNFTALLAEFRKQLDELGAQTSKQYLLTIATPAGPKYYRHMELDQIHKHLDWINVMTYDFHGAGEPNGPTNFNAALYKASGDTSADPVAREQFNVDAAVQAYLAAGVPPDKLVVGVPFYGRGWNGVPPTNNGLFQPATGQPKGIWGEAGIYDYKEILKYYPAPSYQRFFHEEAKVPWLYSQKSQTMITYDDPESMRAKAGYVLEHNLGGVMFWELGGDTAKGDLLKALHEGLYPKGAPKVEEVSPQ